MLSDTSTTIDIGITLLFLGFALACISWRVWVRTGAEIRREREQRHQQQPSVLTRAVDEMYQIAAQAWAGER